VFSFIHRHPLLHRGRLGAIMLLASAAVVTAFVQDAVGDPSGHSGTAAPPAGTVALCKAMGLSCAGHWITVAGHRTYALASAFTIDGRGHLVSLSGRVKAHAAALGELRNEGTNLCMSSYGTQTSGDPARQAACNGSANQTWWLSGQGINGYEIHNTGDGWCLTNKLGATSSGNPQTMWPCPGTANYKEEYAFSGGAGTPLTFYPRTPNLSNNGYAVSSGGDTTVGSTVAEYPANRSANQQWSGPISCGGC
jgi:Ricin-type beta-trefoil lectin domain